MDEQQMKALVAKYLQGTCTEAERQAVEAWYNRLDDFDQEAGPLANEAGLQQELWNRIAAERPVSARRFHLHPWKAAAAVLLLILGGTLAYHFLRPQQPPSPVLAEMRPLQLLDEQQAILLTGNGKKIVLDQLADGTLLQEGNIALRKINPHRLEYQAGNTKDNTGWSTLSIPKGTQYELQLPDGSQVWLNAASVLRFRAGGKSRDLELMGEGYFEVAQRPGQPFTVLAAGQTVQVLGTHFNIRAYKDESHPTTTLLEGSVKVSTAHDAGGILKPGEQAGMDDKGQLRIAATDATQVIAWKNGDFDFYNKSLQDVMLDISRWYNVTVAYPGKVPAVRFSGSISRKKSLAEVLRLLSLTHPVKFRQDSGRVLVMP